MNTDNYILRKSRDGLKLLTLNDLESKQFILQNLLEDEDSGNDYTDSLQI